MLLSCQEIRDSYSVSHQKYFRLGISDVLWVLFVKLHPMDVRTTLGLYDYLEICKYSNVYETGFISQECLFLHLVLHPVIPWDT